MTAPRGPVVATIVGTTIATMVCVLPIVFFITYAFNDAVDWSDHARFLTWVLIALVVQALPLALFVSGRTGCSWERSVVATMALSGSVLLLAGAIYAVLNLLPDLDYAVGASASNATCLVLAVLLGVGGRVALGVGRRLTVVPPST